MSSLKAWKVDRKHGQNPKLDDQSTSDTIEVSTLKNWLHLKLEQADAETLLRIEILLTGVKS